MEHNQLHRAGLPLESALRVMVMIHGRGGAASDMLSLATGLHLQGFALLAPQAKNHTWYPFSFLSPLHKNEPWLSGALDWLGKIESDLNAEGFASDDIYFLGFSQGACLSLEYTARNAKRYGGVVAFTGGLIGEEVNKRNYQGDFCSTPIFIGTSDPDAHVPVQRVEDTAAILREMQAELTVKVYENMGHIICQDEINSVNALILRR